MFPIPDDIELVEKPERFQHVTRVLKTLVHVERKCKSLYRADFKGIKGERVTDAIERLEDELRKAGG